MSGQGQGSGEAPCPRKPIQISQASQRQDKTGPRNILQGEVHSLPSSPRHVKIRKSIFSSEPKNSRSMSSSRIHSSKEDLRSGSHNTHRRNSQRNFCSPKPAAIPTPPSPKIPPRKVKSADPRAQRQKDNVDPCQYEDLPSLPLPTLRNTMEQYLDNVKPILPKEEYEDTKSLVEEFEKPGGIGEQVHAMIQEKREKADNWAYDWWLKDMYMNARLPLPVNSNPGMVFPRMNFTSPTEMLSYASRLVMGFISLKMQLDTHSLPQDRAATRETGQPLCMAQYYRLLTTYREPGKIQDKQLSTGEAPKPAEHIIVGRKGRWYSVPVKSNGKWKNLEDVFSTLMDVWESAETSEFVCEEERVAYLTSSNRDKWAEAYSILKNSKVNKASLDSIAESLLIVCLDTESQNISDTSRSMKECFRQMLTGSGSRYNGSNRWYDKTVQLIFSTDGVCGLCYEHSPSEGIAVVQLLEGIIRDLDDKASLPIAYHQNSSYFSLLKWELSDDIKVVVEECIRDLDILDSNNDLEVFHYSPYGKEFIKSCRCSPDAWIQMALQLTMFKLNGNIVPTYESASTRRFRLGRVDSIRSSHPEAQAWCRSFTNKDKPKEEKKRLFEQAMKKQTKVMVANILGEGLDIPMLGLREAAREGALVGRWEQQQLFKDPAYTKVNTLTLSTSQVPIGLSPSFMGYGAVVPDGYGVSYNPYSHSIIFCICSFHSAPTTNSRRFAATLHESLLEMKDMFMK